MKYLITGGGTGGHIYPALSIADEIKKNDEKSEILYVGTENSLESELAPKSGYNFESIRVKGLPRKINKQFFISIKELILGINDSRKIINKFKPDIVIGTGGYVCGPIVLMASLKGIPTMIHEQNAYPGITNKILSRFVDIIAITFEDAKDHFKNPEKIVITGNPIREELFTIDKKLAFEKLNISQDKFVILSFGGSGGQKSLNDSIIGLLDKLPEDIELIHVTGDRLYKDFTKSIENKEIKENIKIYSYLYDMAEALNIADLVISPAGAITLAELSALGIPSILVPKSYTAENHQVFNAQSFEEREASIVILEKDLSAEALYEKIKSVLDNPDKLSNMANNSLKLGDKTASTKIYSEIIKLLTL